MDTPNYQVETWDHAAHTWTSHPALLTGIDAAVCALSHEDGSARLVVARPQTVADVSAAGMDRLHFYRWLVDTGRLPEYAR